MNRRAPGGANKKPLRMTPKITFYLTFLDFLTIILQVTLFYFSYHQSLSGLEHFAYLSLLQIIKGIKYGLINEK